MLPSGRRSALLALDLLHCLRSLPLISNTATHAAVRLLGPRPQSAATTLPAALEHQGRHGRADWCVTFRRMSSRSKCITAIGGPRVPHGKRRERLARPAAIRGGAAREPRTKCTPEQQYMLAAKKLKNFPCRTRHGSQLSNASESTDQRPLAADRRLTADDVRRPSRSNAPIASLKGRRVPSCSASPQAPFLNHRASPAQRIRRPESLRAGVRNS